MGESVLLGLIGVLVGGLQAAIFALLKQINGKVQSMCEDNKAAHEDLGHILYHHYHNDEGDVVIRGK